MNRDEFIAALRTKTPAHFVDDHLFDRVPAVFDADRAAFVSWKRALAERIEVDPACIAVVGSAATGTSLNPYKNFKPFDHESDIDVAVISSYHFNVAWRYLRMNGARRLTVDPRTRIAWDEHVKKYIYWGTIATDRLLGVLPFGLEWLRATAAISQLSPTIGRDINLRIYADYDSLRNYQVTSARSARDALLGA
jgi:predicted nucleotidyltransferase